MMSENAVSLLAFYLPQYHPIPENDTWWGKGFTDWTNVARARPLFPGHYEPHLPADLGFYDLRLPEARQAQADLAREYGISGFVYYHYWFNGKRLLGRPFDEVLNAGQPEFPFCLCWANENWTRAWDGNERQMLIEQTYSEEDDRQHITWLLATFKDKRYIRIGGKPLLLVYRVNRLPDAPATFRLWRQEAQREGEDLFLCRVESFEDERTSPVELGLDAAVEFQPDWTGLVSGDSRIPYGDHSVVDYAAFVEQQLGKRQPPYLRFPCVTPSWDNSARRQNRALILDHSTPERYGHWLRVAIECAARNAPEHRLVFVNAWNEWAEGNHLEPDLVWGRRYLEETRRALDAVTENAPEADLAGIVDQQRKQIEELELDRRRLQQTFQDQARWAQELETTTLSQAATIQSYQRGLGPFLRLVRALRRK